MLLSAEAQNTLMGLDPTDVIVAVFRNAFGREPGPAEVSGWKIQFDSAGQDRMGEVVVTMISAARNAKGVDDGTVTRRALLSKEFVELVTQAEAGGAALDGGIYAKAIGLYHPLNILDDQVFLTAREGLHGLFRQQ